LFHGKCKILINVLSASGEESSRIAERLRALQGPVLSKGSLCEKYYNFVCHDSDSDRKLEKKGRGKVRLSLATPGRHVRAVNSCSIYFSIR
jgi:hypothetical protein